MQLLVILTALWMSEAGSAEARCDTVAQCWLDPSGNAIKRPTKYARRPIPHGDCGGKLVWTRHRLFCQEHRCRSIEIADMCLVP